ncbi:hypothetical protein FJW05_00065 [Mesorhizobium sp. B2-9-1]|nr:hypothetical protein FJW05_00065 [Mesorhizobium sp. B2-9-1]TPJ15622.1 hypothetical protein FJ425_29745 [Mesorhizobium sp. B2-7-2]
MRGAPEDTSVSLRWNTPHPSRRYAPIHLLSQGEKETVTQPSRSRPRPLDGNRLAASPMRVPSRPLCSSRRGYR